MAQVGVRNYLWQSTGTVISYCKYCAVEARKDAADTGHDLVETHLGTKTYCQWGDHRQVSREGEALEKGSK